MNCSVRKFSPLFLALSAVVFLTQCSGYQIGSVKPSVYQDISRLHVPTFENTTLEPRISAIVTNAVIKELQKDGTYKVSNQGDADAILKGRITHVERQQLRAAQTDTLKTTEMRLFIVVQWSLTDPGTGSRLAYTEGVDLDETRIDTATSNLQQRPGRVIGETIQFLDPNFQLSERNALPVAAEDAAEKLVSQLANGW